MLFPNPDRADAAPTDTLAMLRSCDDLDLLPENFLRPSELADALREFGLALDGATAAIAEAQRRIEYLKLERDERKAEASAAVSCLTGEAS